MNRQDLIDRLAERTAYPADAVSYCLDQRDRTAAIFLPILEKAAAGKPIPKTENQALFLGLHLLAALRVEKAFYPLQQLAVQIPLRLHQIFGEDALGSTFPRILISICHDQKDLLWQAFEAKGSDFLIRDAFLRAWTYEVLEHRLSQAAAVRLLTGFLDGSDAPPGDDPIWIGWMNAIADLGYRDLVPVVERALSSGQILSQESSLADTEFRSFDSALKEAEASEDRSAFQADRGYIPFGETRGDWGAAFLCAPKD